MSHLLNNVPTEGLPVYGCHNKQRPINGKNVLPLNGGYGYGHTVVLANTVWDGAESGKSVPCMYQVRHDDVMCAGCKHQKRGGVVADVPDVVVGERTQQYRMTPLIYDDKLAKRVTNSAKQVMDDHKNAMRDHILAELKVDSYYNVNDDKLCICVSAVDDNLVEFHVVNGAWDGVLDKSTGLFWAVDYPDDKSKINDIWPTK